MIKWIAKKWLIKCLNETLHDIKDNKKIDYWRSKIKAVTVFLLDVQDSIEDNNLSDEEIEKIVDGCTALFKE